MRILVVEDNEVNALLVMKALGGAGHEMVHVLDGAAAVERTARESFDLVFMDVHMPVMDGYEATRHIRAREANDPTSGRLFITALTANAMHGDERACVDAGMDRYLAKPITAPKLREFVASIPKAGGAVEPSVPAAATAQAPAAPAAQAPPGEPAVFDVRDFEQRVDDVTLSKAIATRFLQRQAKTLDALHEAVLVGDPEKVRFAAHAAKGSFAAVSAVVCREIACTIEDRARAGDTTEAAALEAALVDASRSLTTALEAYLGR